MQDPASHRFDTNILGLAIRIDPEADVTAISAQHRGLQPPAGVSNDGDRPWQRDADFREFARPRIDLDGAAVLLDDDVMADGQAKAGALSGRLRREEWIEDLFLHVRRNTGAIVPYPDFYAIAKALGRGSEDRFIAIASGLRLAFCGRVKTVRNQIQ